MTKAIEVPVGKDHVALIDAEDWPKVKIYAWYAQKDSRDSYMATTWDKPRMLMHRFILDLSDRSQFVVHKDGNLMNNQKSNLVITDMKGVMGTRRLNSNAPLAFKGVKQFRDTYVATIRDNAGLKRHLGTFPTPEAAARAYDKAALAIWGELAATNKRLGLL